MADVPEDMVEKVARGICNRRKPKPAKGDAFDNLKSWADVDELNGDSREELEGYYDDARAAIEAMMEPGADVLDALLDKQSPFVGRRKMDKSGGEVVELLNDDWRTTIPLNDEIAHRGDYPSERDANAAAERMNMRRKWQAALRTSLSKGGE